MPRSRAVSSHASRAAKCCQRAARLSVRAPMRRENEGRRRRGERTSRRARWARSTAAKMATATADDRYVDASSRAMRRSNSLEAVAAWDDSQATRGHEIREHTDPAFTRFFESHPNPARRADGERDRDVGPASSPKVSTLAVKLKESQVRAFASAPREISRKRRPRVNEPRTVVEYFSHAPRVFPPRSHAGGAREDDERTRRGEGAKQAHGGAHRDDHAPRRHRERERDARRALRPSRARARARAHARGGFVLRTRRAADRADDGAQVGRRVRMRR